MRDETRMLDNLIIARAASSSWSRIRCSSRSKFRRVPHCSGVCVSVRERERERETERERQRERERALARVCVCERESQR